MNVQGKRKGGEQAPRLLTLNWESLRVSVMQTAQRWRRHANSEGTQRGMLMRRATYLIAPLLDAALQVDDVLVAGLVQLVAGLQGAGLPAKGTLGVLVHLPLAPRASCDQ
jgi:hypothetical protein